MSQICILQKAGWQVCAVYVDDERAPFWEHAGILDQAEYNLPTLLFNLWGK